MYQIQIGNFEGNFEGKFDFFANTIFAKKWNLYLEFSLISPVPIDLLINFDTFEGNIVSKFCKPLALGIAMV